MSVSRVCKHCVNTCQRGQSLERYNKNFNKLLFMSCYAPLIVSIGGMITNNMEVGLVGFGCFIVGIQLVELLGAQANSKDKKRDLNCVKIKV